MNTNSQQEDADQGKIESGMNQNGDSAGLEVPKLDEAILPRHLNEQSGG